MTALRLAADAPFRTMVGVGGIGGGMFLALEGDATLGREESRGARLLDAHDACKLHIVAHHVAVLLGARPSGTPFHVVPLGCVGDDDPGRWALATMGAAGIDTAQVRTTRDRPTLFSVCFLYPDGSGGNITTLDSAASALAEADVDVLEPLLDAHTVALAAPEVGLAPRRRLLELATEHGAFRAASFVSGEIAAARDEGLFALADLVALNADEAAALAGRTLDRAEAAPFLDAVAAAADVPRLVVTAGADGAFGFEGGRWRHRAAIPVEVASAAGAGDALLGGVLAGLAAGVPLLPAADGPAEHLTCALDLGVLLAGCSATSPHTIHPGADLAALAALARETGLTFGPPLSDVM
ncbi:MAG: carbohydrate kinase family protein [Actinomycetota bacterium]